MSMRAMVVVTAVVSSLVSALVILAGLAWTGSTYAQSPSGAGSVAALSQATSYWRTAGVAFQPRDSVTGYLYDQHGCIRRNAGSESFAASLNLPDGAVIKYLTFYYNNVGAGGAGTAFIYAYNGLGTTTAVATIGSNTLLGYDSAVSQEVTHTVSLQNMAYVLIWTPTLNDNRLCGMQVTYNAPASFGVALPLIRR